MVLKAYSKALSKLMSDKDLRDKIAENGRDALVRFSPENTFKQWQELMEELL